MRAPVRCAYLGVDGGRTQGKEKQKGAVNCTIWVAGKKTFRVDKQRKSQLKKPQGPLLIKGQAACPARGKTNMAKVAKKITVFYSHRPTHEKR